MTVIPKPITTTAIETAVAPSAGDGSVLRRWQRHQSLAEELGPAWVGGARDAPPSKLDAAIIFTPAGDLITAAD